MRVFNDRDIEQERAAAVTLGNFDGIHKGHQALIETVKKYAESENLLSVVFSFYPHPVSVVRADEKFYTILTPDEKIKVLEQFGVDVLIQYPFTKEFSYLDADTFVNMLYNSTKLKVLVVGEDYCFGKDRHGDLDMLKEYGKKMGFKVIGIPKVEFDSERVSSTRIRRCINEADFKHAQKLLNKPYFVMGDVRHGKKIGKKIGFPTANIICDEEKLLPPDGVYATRTIYKGETFDSITNIGKNPTVNGTDRTVETFLFGFDEEIYGEEICVLFYERIRGEKKFNSMEELKKQIGQDKEAVHRLYG